MKMPSSLFETLVLNASHASSARSQIPAFLYGCAWKKDMTTDLVHDAILSGFKGIDVAAQPKHYREDLAGEGIRKAIAEGKVKREDLFIQTKFTSVQGQTLGRMPYDPSAPIPTQVQTSVASSLKNLRADDSSEPYIDSLVLHSPLPTLPQTLEAWSTLEPYVPNKIRNLGISNTSLPILAALYDAATVKPSVVQNRFYGDTGYDAELRKWCREKGIVYQSFWTLTANPRLMRSQEVQGVAKGAGTEPPVALYALVMGLEGTIVLNGTSSHMVSDLEGLERIKKWATQNPEEWQGAIKKFKAAVGDDVA